MSSARPALAPIRSLPLARRLPAAHRRAAERDWVFFLLEELNGLGDILRFRLEEDPEARLAETTARAQAIVTALGWQADTAIEQTWAFVKTRLLFPEDAWGPDVVLGRLDGGPRWRSWRAGLGDEARTILAQTPIPV